MTLLEEYYKRSTLEMTISKKILFEILADFTDRRGLRQEWEQIDDDVQDEILSAWLKIIQNNLEEGQTE